MNTIKIKVQIDQKAALLRGEMLQDQEVVEVSPELVGAELWVKIVGWLNMAENPPTLRSGHRYPAATAEAIRALHEKVDKEEKELTEARRAEYEARLVAFEAAGPDERIRNDYGYEWAHWSMPYYSHPYGVEESLLPVNHDAREQAKKDALQVLIDAHNAPHLVKVEEARVAAEQAAAERKRVEDAAKAEALKVTKAKRLETGYWEKETPSYNERRYGPYWCAAVSFPNGPKAVYGFGDSTSRWGNAGLLRIACKPGDIIAWGQKDTRKPGSSEHHILRMRDDGGMDEIDKTEAFRLSQKA